MNNISLVSSTKQTKNPAKQISATNPNHQYQGPVNRVNPRKGKQLGKLGSNQSKGGQHRDNKGRS